MVLLMFLPERDVILSLARQFTLYRKWMNVFHINKIVLKQHSNGHKTTLYLLTLDNCLLY